MGDLKTWVSDNLMSLLGFSQPTIVQFVITLSKKASSPSEIVKQLTELGITSSSETNMFAKEIFARVEHKTSGPNLYQQQEREAAMLARKQKSFKLLEADDEEEDMVPVAPLPKKEKTRGKKFRKRSETQDDMDDAVVKNEGKERRVRSRISHDKDDGSESEEERLRDQREREELERHMRERDEVGTRKMTDQKLTKKEEEEAIRRSKALEDDGLGTLRHMDESETSYQPPAGFVEDKKDPLIDLDLTDSTELWLIQWPVNQPLDFDGQQMSMKLGGDGSMGTLEGSSGKSYEMISYKSQGPEASVFLTSASSEAKIAGKISRRVSLIHYPDPNELQKRNGLNLSHSQRSSSTTSGRRSATPSRSLKPTKSTVSGYPNPTKTPKRKQPEPSKSTSHSGRDSGKGNSGVTSTDSVEHSQERKSKKKKMKD